MTDFNNFNYREINATQSNFIGFVSNGKIYNSFNQQIGVTNEEYKKAIDTAKDYEQILYDKGILEKPKKAEVSDRKSGDCDVKNILGAYKPESETGARDE